MVEKASFGPQVENPVYGDMHTHTNYSDGIIFCDGTRSPVEIVDLAEELGMSFLGITDHDTIVPSVIGQNHAEKQGYKVKVLIGEEISSKGHILAYNLNDNIPFGMSVVDTVRAIHRQGGYAVAAHPFYRVTPSLGGEAVRTVGEHEDPEVYWDGIEVFNAGVHDFRFYERLTRRSEGNKKAQEFYNANKENGNYGIPTGGSDTHTSGVGRGLVVIPEGVTIYQAFQTKEVGVIQTDRKEQYSPRTLYRIDRRAKATEALRQQMPEWARKFPAALPSSY